MCVCVSSSPRPPDGYIYCIYIYRGKEYASVNNQGVYLQHHTGTQTMEFLIVVAFPISHRVSLGGGVFVGSALNDRKIFFFDHFDFSNDFHDLPIIYPFMSFFSSLLVV